jgi:N-acetylglutamate synthase-like GNAT family acetyltransferase
MVQRPAMVKDQDRVEIRLTREAEYRLPFTFIEALNEGTLFDRSAHIFRDAARQHRLFHVVNRSTENILGTGVVQPASSGPTSATQAEVGGLMVHPAARGFGLASLLLKVMMVHPRFGCGPSCLTVKRWETWFCPFGSSYARTAA